MRHEETAAASMLSTVDCSDVLTAQRNFSCLKTYAWPVIVRALMGWHTNIKLTKPLLTFNKCLLKMVNKLNDHFQRTAVLPLNLSTSEHRELTKLFTTKFGQCVRVTTQTLVHTVHKQIAHLPTAEDRKMPQDAAKAEDVNKKNNELIFFQFLCECIAQSPGAEHLATRSSTPHACARKNLAYHNTTATRKSAQNYYGARQKAGSVLTYTHHRTDNKTGTNLSLGKVEHHKTDKTAKATSDSLSLCTTMHTLQDFMLRLTQQALLTRQVPPLQKVVAAFEFILSGMPTETLSTGNLNATTPITKEAHKAAMSFADRLCKFQVFALPPEFLPPPKHTFNKSRTDDKLVVCGNCLGAQNTLVVDQDALSQSYTKARKVTDRRKEALKLVRRDKHSIIIGYESIVCASRRLGCGNFSCGKCLHPDSTLVQIPFVREICGTQVPFGIVTEEGVFVRAPCCGFVSKLFCISSGDDGRLVCFWCKRNEDAQNAQNAQTQALQTGSEAKQTLDGANFSDKNINESDSDDEEEDVSDVE